MNETIWDKLANCLCWFGIHYWVYEFKHSRLYKPGDRMYCYRCGKDKP